MARRLQPVPDAPRRAGLLVRVSDTMGRAGEDFMSPTTQVDRMTAAAERDGDRVVEVWEDIDRTGRTTVGRTGLAAAVQAARDGRIDVLYVYDLSRWARNTADGLALLAEVESYGVPVASATERIDRSTSSGRLTVGLLLLLAEHQSDLIGDRWKDTISTNARRGVWHGRPPQGYVRVAKREIAPDPVEGPLWAEAFQRYAAGEGLRQVAVWLTAARGRVTQPNEVSRTLRSPAYRGLVVLAGRTYPGRHEPLVDQPTWDAVQARLEANKWVPSRTKQAVHSLAGLLRCGRCGGAVHRRNRKDRGLGPFVFCSTAVVDRERCPGIGAPPLEPIERAVLDELAARVAGASDTSAALAAAEDSRRARAATDTRTLQDEIAKTEKALGSLAVKNATGVLSDVAVRVASASLEEALERLQAQARDVAQTADAPSFAESASLAQALLDLWPSMTSVERNEAIRTHVRSVAVLPATSSGSRRPRRVQVTWVDGSTSSTPRTATPQPQGEDGRFTPR